MIGMLGWLQRQTPAAQPEEASDVSNANARPTGSRVERLVSFLQWVYFVAAIDADARQSLRVGTEMLVKDVMTSTIVSVSPDNSVRQAAMTMLSHHISGIPVIDGDGHLLGIISEGDLIRRTELGGAMFASAEDLAAPAEDRANAYVRRSSWRVAEAMTPAPVTIDEDASLLQAARLMQKHGVKRIPVIRHGELVGIVSRADLLQAIATAKLDGTPSGDEAIQRSVMVRLRENTGLEAFDIKIAVTNGIVHLSGAVAIPECRRAARIVAESVQGVQGVVDHFT